jgi:hypothetical protein
MKQPNYIKMSSLNIQTGAVTSVLPLIILFVIILIMFCIYLIYQFLSQLLSHQTYLATHPQEVEYESECLRYGDDTMGRETFFRSEGGDTTHATQPTSSANDAASSQLLAEPGAPHAVTNYIQTQVAAEIIELTTLKSDVFDEHYSTPMYVGQYTVSTTNVTGNLICGVTNTTIAANNNYKRMFIDKRFAKYDIRFTINVTGNPFATGLMAFANLPCYQRVPTGPIDQDPIGLGLIYQNYLQRILATDHIIVDLSVDGVYTIDMPFTYYRSLISCFDYATREPWAYLFGAVLTPLLPATGAPTTVNFEIYATLMNLQFVETAPYYSQGLFSWGETNNVTYKLENIRDSTLPINVSGDSLSASATIPFGFDNPSDTRNPSTMLQSVYQKIASYANVLNVFRASTQPERLETFNKERMHEMRLPEDEMALSFFNGKWAGDQLYTTAENTSIAALTPFSITPSTATNTVLFWTYLSPSSLSFAGATVNSSYLADFRSVIVANSSYWRGTLKYRICIAGNSFKRGKILVAINYCSDRLKYLYSGPITTGELDPRSLPHIIIDLSSEDRYVDIEVPYKSINELTRTAAFNNDVGELLPSEDFTIGQLIVALVSPLQVSQGTASTVNLTLLSSYGEDMTFFQKPGTSRSGPVTEAKMTPSSLVPTSSFSIPSIPRLTSLKELLLNPVHYGSYRIPFVFGTNNPDTIAIPISAAFMANSPEWSAIMSMYCGSKGSIRIIARLVNTQVGPIQLRMLPYMRLPQSPAPYNTGPLTDTGAAYGNTAFFGGASGYKLPPTGNKNPTALPGQLATATNSYTHCVIDELNQPEAIMEFPDMSPMYKTQPSKLLPLSYFAETPTNYNPQLDRNVSWLLMNALNQEIVTPPTPNVAATVSLYIVAGDDYRNFWYNGGPINYSSNVTADAATSTITPSPFNNP